MAVPKVLKSVNKATELRFLVTKGLSLTYLRL